MTCLVDDFEEELQEKAPASEGGRYNSKREGRAPPLQIQLVTFAWDMAISRRPRKSSFPVPR